MQTAVSQVILTSSTSDSTTQESTGAEPDTNSILNERLEELNTQLEDANNRVDEQAAQIETLQNELSSVYILLTPTITPTPQDTPTPTITPTSTPLPAPTEFVLPWYQKYVVAKKDAPLYYYEDENEAGYPLMLKTSPVVKIAKGTEFIVDTNRIRADGGGYYYIIIGPKHEGYYVSINDVDKVD
jgi:hypothetical protein